MDIEPNALIILVIMVVGGLKWLLETIKEKKEQEQDEGETGFVDLYEEARQEIQERQNQEYPGVVSEAPYEQYADPIVFQPTATAPPTIPVPAIFTTPAPPPLPTTPARRSPTRATLSIAEKAALERVQAKGMGSLRPRRRRSSHSKVRELLASPAAARDAIVLREILGTPKGNL